MRAYAYSSAVECPLKPGPHHAATYACLCIQSCCKSTLKPSPRLVDARSVADRTQHAIALVLPQRQPVLPEPRILDQVKQFPLPRFVVVVLCCLAAATAAAAA